MLRAAFIFIVSIAVSGCFCALHGADRRVTFYDERGQTACSFNVEIAATEEEHERGLMFRESLPDNGGMLFLYNNDEVRYFWMKNTLIALDMIFISAKRRVVSVFHAARPMDGTTISSIYPARYVLEVNAGKAKQCNIKAGTKVRFLTKQKGTFLRN